jgi:hypothetical protein
MRLKVILDQGVNKVIELYNDNDYYCSTFMCSKGLATIYIGGRKAFTFKHYGCEDMTTLFNSETVNLCYWKDSCVSGVVSEFSAEELHKQVSEHLEENPEDEEALEVFQSVEYEHEFEEALLDCGIVDAFEIFNPVDFTEDFVTACYTAARICRLYWGDR